MANNSRMTLDPRVKWLHHVDYHVLPNEVCMSQPSTTQLPITVRVFGPLTVLHGSASVGLAPRSRAHGLLAYLLLHHGRSLERAYLASQFDPDLPDATARRRLSDTLYALRRFIPEDRLQTTSTSISLVFQPHDSCDVLTLEKLLQVPVAHVDSEALLAFAEPVLCPELDYEWIVAARESFWLRFISYLERLADHANEQADYPTARAVLDRVLQLDPARETAQLALLRVFEQLGRAAEAAQQYQQWKQRLQTEFGFSPEPETERCYQRLMRLLREREGRPQVLLPEQLPLVGRDAERRFMLNLMEQAQPQTSVVLLEGMAGIGKSHLLQHVAADAAWRDWMVGVGRASGLGNVLEAALQPLLTPVVIKQLQTIIAPHWWSQVKTIFPVPDDAPEQPVQTDAGLTREQYHEALLQLIEALATLAPVLLIVDDMHEATLGELAALLPIISLTTSHPLVLIASYRGSIRDDHECWSLLRRLDAAAAGQRLLLQPLSQAQCATLLFQVLGPCSSAMVEQLTQFTGGHPLFLCETLDFLLERGALQRQPDGNWGFDPRELATVQLADASRAIAARVAQLSPAESTMLTYLALHPGELSLQHLEQLTGWSDSQVAVHIQHLLQRHLIVAAAAGYTCRHALITQALRETLDQSTRRAFHDQLFQVLKHHQAIPVRWRAWHAFAAEDWSAALPLLQAAAHAARLRADYRTALQLLDQATEALAQPTSVDHTDQQIQVLLEYLHVWNWHAPVGQQRTATLELLKTLLFADHPAWAEWHVAQLNDLLDRGENQMALAVAEQRIAELTARDDPGYHMKLLMLAGKAAQRSGTHEQGIAYHQQALALAEAVGEIEVQVGASGNLAIYDHYRGDFAAARAGYTRVEQLCEQHGLIMAGITATSNLAAIAQAEGDLAAALQGYETAVAGYERYALVDPTDLENLAEVYILLGAYDRAEAVLLHADSLWHEREASPALTRCRQATLVIAREQLEQGRSLLAEALKLNDAGGDMRVEGEAQLWLAYVALEQGRWAEAEPLLNQVDALYARLGVHFYAAVIGSLRAIIAARQGYNDQARQCLNNAAAALEVSFSTFVDPHYFYGAAAETVGDRTLARDHYRAAWQRIERHTQALPLELAALLQAAPLSQRIHWAVRRCETTQSLLLLPFKCAPTGRARHPWEEVPVLWELPPSPPVDPAARQAVLQQLLQQAHYQEATATVAALAEALQVSVATVSRDLSELRQRGKLHGLFSEKNNA